MAFGYRAVFHKPLCETVVIIKDEGDYSFVKCDKGRGKKFRPFAISVNSDWLPYILEPDQWEIKTETNKPVKF